MKEKGIIALLFFSHFCYCPPDKTDIAEKVSILLYSEHNPRFTQTLRRALEQKPKTTSQKQKRELYEAILALTPTSSPTSSGYATE